MAACLTAQQSAISRGLYNIVQDKIGNEEIVKLRRHKYQIIDGFQNSDIERGYTMLIRGSRSEGYLFNSSDIDVMYVDRRSIVFSHGNLRRFLNVSEDMTVLQYIDSSPGFVTIKCLDTCEKNEHLRRTCVERGNQYYVSSKLFKEYTYYIFGKDELKPHGPCISGSYGLTEFDLGFCLRCGDWPEQAASFIHRANVCGWPARNVLQTICKDDCLLMPIFSKELRIHSDISDIEWRFSFSVIEKKLMEVMNHSQFLCLGLWKIYLNDILKQNTEICNLLCSYHIKTALFWEISENAAGWTPATFISKFWAVFRRIMSWVRNEHCPHFFVPERNMFVGKVYGQRRASLESVLLSLYQEREESFLRCQTIANVFMPILLNPFNSHYVHTDEERRIPLLQLEAVSYFEVNTPRNLHNIYIELKKLMKLNESRPELHSIIKLRIHRVLQSLADFHFCIFERNKFSYKENRFALNLLKKSYTFCFTNKILLIMRHHKLKNYYMTIRLINDIKARMIYKTYRWSPDTFIVNKSTMDNIPMELFIKRNVLSFVSLNSFNTIDELKLECTYLRMNKELRIPPLVFLEFILVLSYNSISDMDKRNERVLELDSLLRINTSPAIHESMRAISLEILGMCQLLCGDNIRALSSFFKALRDNHNDFKSATFHRIKSLLAV